MSLKSFDDQDIFNWFFRLLLHSILLPEFSLVNKPVLNTQLLQVSFSNSTFLYSVLVR